MDTNASSPNKSARGTTGSDMLAVAVSISAVIWAAAAGTAHAQTVPAASETVSVADLDLSTADGARTFFKRLDIAAQRACGDEPVRSPLTPREPARFEQCVKDAIAAAVRDADTLDTASLAGSTTLASR